MQFARCATGVQDSICPTRRVELVVRSRTPSRVRDFFARYFLTHHAPRTTHHAVGSTQHFSVLRSPSIQDTTKRVRVNRQIRISPLRVIGADGSQLGILEVDAAMAMAESQGLDLVEVAPLARPPVVRIMDYGKYKFEQAKQARVAKKKQHIIHLKEVKYRPGIDDNDFDTKTRHARRFLEEKNKVKVTMQFRGRQVAHPELGKVVLDRIASDLADIAKVESEGRLEGKFMTMILTPK